MLTFRISGCHEGVLRPTIACVHPLSFLIQISRARILILAAAALLFLSWSHERCLGAPPNESLKSLRVPPGFKSTWLRPNHLSMRPLPSIGHPTAGFG